MNDNKKTIKAKRKRLKIGYVLSAIAILLVLVVAIKMILPSGSSKYGNRLDGIKKITFGKNEKNKIVEKVKSSDKVTDAKVETEGRIINIMFNVSKDTSKDDAKNIGNSSLESISDEVKSFYDIQVMITKKDEDVVKETKEDGTVVEKTEFPIMGYKNTRSQGIVW